MDHTKSRFFYIFNFLVSFTLSQLNESDSLLFCRPQWYRFRKCLTDHQNDYSDQPKLSAVQVEAFVRDLTKCYKNQQCREPLPALNERVARRNCFREMKQKIDRDLQTCVKKEKFNDYDLVGANEVAFTMAQNKNYLNWADRNGDLCPETSDRQFIDECVKNEVQRHLLNKKPAERQHLCDVTKQCWAKSASSADCKQRYTQATLVYCTCATNEVKLKMPEHVQKFSECLKRFGFSYEESLDVFGLWLSAFGDDQCSPTSSINQCTDSDNLGSINVGSAAGGNSENGQWVGRPPQPESGGSGRNMFNGGNGGSLVAGVDATAQNSKTPFGTGNIDFSNVFGNAG